MSTSRRIMHIDMTGDEPVVSYVDAPNRPALANVTNTPRVTGRRGRRIEEDQFSVSNNEENTDPVRLNRHRGRRARREQREQQVENPLPIEGLGMKSGNPWIQHVKSFAVKNNMPYWQALKSAKCKSSYKGSSSSKKGKGILDDIKNVGNAVGSAFAVGGVNPFTAGYNLGHDVIAPAIFGSGLKQGNSWIRFVKSFAEKNNMNYRDALKDPRCKSSYKKGSGFDLVDSAMDKYGNIVDSLKSGNVRDIANSLGKAVIF